MPIPTWSVGQVLTSQDVNSWFVPLAVVKPGDTTRTGTTPSDDPDLVLAMAANATYLFTAYIRFQVGSVGNWWKVTWTVPSGTIMRYAWPNYFPDDTGAAHVLQSSAGADIVNVQGTVLQQGFALHGTITTAGTAGNVRLQWALGAGVNITVQQYSWLRLDRVA